MTHQVAKQIFETSDLTEDVEGGAVEAKINELIRANDVIVFSKTNCPFCLELKRTLASYGVSFAVFEADKTHAYGQIKSALQAKTGISTFPNLFIRGDSIGGCMDVKNLELSGKLFALLAPFIGKERNKGPEVDHMGFLWYTEIANNHAVRLTGLFTMIYCILCVIFYRSYPTRWAVLALAFDCTARFIWGPTHSLVASLSSALLINVPPKWTGSPPKQFATFCGVFFTVFAAGLYLGGHPVGGAVLMAVFALAVCGESIFDFCIGCWTFSMAVYLGIVPGSVYQPYLNMYPAYKWQYDFMNEKRTYPVAVNEHVLLPGQTEPTKIDLVRKDRLELEYKLQDVHLIRHTKIDHFAIPMAVAALAYFFKFTDNTSENADFNGGFAYQVLAIVSVILCGIIGIFYFLRLVLYPQKIWKEWMHPSYGNYFSAITICITLYGLLLLPKSVNGGGALIWIGSVGQMLLTVLRVADFVYHPVSDEYLNPSVMMAPVGNYICAIGFSTFGGLYNGPNLRGDVNYLYVARIWFAIATLYSIVLFTITLGRSFRDTHSDYRNRPTLYVWLATAGISGPAYLAVTSDPFAGTGLVFQSLWYIALFFFTIFAVGYFKNFFVSERDMSMWIIPFSLSAFAIGTVQYQIQAPSQLFSVLSIIAGAIACASMAICGLQTLGMILDLTFWTPRMKWGPITFLKLTHESFRFAVPKLVTMLNAVDGSNPKAVNEFAKELENFFVTYGEHAKHEDDVVHVRTRRYFPNFNPTIDEEHEYQHEILAKMEEELQRFQSAVKSGGDLSMAAKVFLAFYKDTFPAWGDHLLKHLRNEEVTLTNVMRKYVPLDYMKVYTQECYEITSGDAWRVVMPYVINNLPAPSWKVRYLRCFIWADPTRAQELGLILYPNLDTVTWAFLAREIPEIIPRGLAGYKRYY